MFFTKFISIIVLAIVASAQHEDYAQHPSDNLEAGSQTLYKYVSVPIKSIKYVSPLSPDFQLRPLLKYKRPPHHVTKPKRQKPMFTPDPKYIGYTNFRLASLGVKNPTFNSKYPEVFKPIHPNFHSDLATVKLPISHKDTKHSETLFIRHPNPHDYKNSFKQPQAPSLFGLENDFLESASPKQIEKYLEDQQKLKDEKIELELLNDPNPEAKGKYQQFLKAKEDEKIEMDYIEELKMKKRERANSYAPVLVREPKPIKKSETLGLRHYRTHESDGSAYEFEITLP